MAVSPYTEAGDTSKPVKRIRWATQRVTGRKASQKRKSLFARHGSKRVADEKKRESDGTDPDLQKSETDGGDEEEEKPAGRSIYVNIPLPDSARDEDGKPKQNFKRNKIRTAKYTPISFVPKNLWLQFHNVANIYFLFVVILSVGTLHLHILEHGTDVMAVLLRFWSRQSGSSRRSPHCHCRRDRHQRRHRRLATNCTGQPT